MLRGLVEACLRQRVVVAVLAALTLGYGFWVAGKAKLDVFPNFVQPQVVVQTECPGLGPEQVEVLVTVPVETELNGLGSLESLRSESIGGLSIVTAVFREGTDVFLARQTLAEKLAELAGRLPQGVGTPRLTPLTSSTMDLLKIGLVSDTMSPMELRGFVDWTLKPRLLSIPGVAKASVFGGEVRQLQILVEPERLQAFHLSIDEVLAAARAATGIAAAGFLENDNQRITLETEGQSLTPEALAHVALVRPGAQALTLGDVAHVVFGAEPRFGDTLIQGRPGVLVTMSSQYGANTLEVTRALEAALAELEPTLAQAGVRMYGRLHRPATFIENALGHMQSSLALGALLVAVVLFAMLASWRTAGIALLAIPLSLLAAVLVLDGLGVTINTMTLGGLAIALGEVVDDSIIDVENIFRRLRQNRGLGSPRSSFAVVLDASLEVRGSVVYATFVVALIFVPVLTLTGVQGSFFRPLALAYVLATLASLGVALMLTPGLALLLLPGAVADERDAWLQRRLQAGYDRVLALAARAPGWTLAAVAALCIFGATRLPSLGGELLPEFREGHFVLQVSTIPGTSLAEMRRVGALLSRQLLAIPGIATVEQQIGRAELGEDPWGPNRSELHVDLEPVDAAAEEVIEARIRGVLAGVSGIQSEVLTFLGDRIGETLTGETAAVVVSVYGPDLDVLDDKAREVAEILRQIPGAADVQRKAPPGAPRLSIRLRPERLAPLGLRPLDVLEAVRTAYEGTVVAQTHEGNRITDVVVKLEGAGTLDPESVGALMLDAPGGLRVPLAALADLELGSGRALISHEGAGRRQVVTCNPIGRDVGSLVDEARARLGRIQLPAGTYLSFGGAAEARVRAETQLGASSLVALVGVVLLLAVAFRTGRNLLLVLVNLPLALVGGVLAVWLAGLLEPGELGLSVGSLVGFVTLFGITTRNSIMMVSHFEHLVLVDGLPWGLETARRGARERLVPIVMTAAVTGLGLLPLALGAGEAGREIEGPMAIVILGGLTTSTVLNLLVLPILAVRFARFPEPTSEGTATSA